MLQEMPVMSSGGGATPTFSIDEYQLSTNTVGEHVDFTCTNAFIAIGQTNGTCSCFAKLDNGEITKYMGSVSSYFDFTYTDGVLSAVRKGAYAPQYSYIKIMYI